MESQSKPGADGNGGSDVKVVNPSSMRSSDFFLRLLAVATTLVAAIVMGLAKETQLVPVVLTPALPTLYIRMPAKMRYSSAFVFFVVSNAIACAYAAFSLVVSFAKGGNGKGMTMAMSILDLIMVALLFSGNGAAAAVGLIGAKGNSHVGWHKVCNVYGKFCRYIGVSIIVSLIGSLIFVLLVVLSTVSLYKRSRF
eukprot:TRINITY_DN6784_c0_g1_i1.p1 TRINITY_DN6784_c0_g1~~TRINITY_DN6784_c0_g1_i1.p1  ORF type:complete len:196 (+),score=2.35 TRINITY_DN6784_c0_g1_i1:324-911(+)